MAVNINNPVNNPNRVVDSKVNANNAAATSNPQNTAAQATQVAQSAPRPVTSDTVSLTNQAQQVNQAKRAGDANTPVNQEKVERLKKAIVSGEYRIDVERLAEKIANHEKQLFGS